MKNIIKALALALTVSVLCTTTISAKTPPAINSNLELEKAIEAVIDFPDIENRDFNKETVNVIFKIDLNGQVVVKRIEGYDKICQDVRKSLEKLFIEEQSMYGKYFSKKITFKLIN
jgi:hypothetical protein